MNNPIETHPVPVHSFSFDDLIAGLAHAHTRFSQYIDRCWHDLDVKQLAGALSVHAMIAIRLARLLRDRCALGILGPPPVQLDPFIADLNGKLARLNRYVDTHWPDPGTWQWRRLVSLYSMNLGRLSRLIRHRRALRHAPLHQFQRAIHTALHLPVQNWNADPPTSNIQYPISNIHQRHPCPET